jgi:hypothetical protein
MRDASCRDRVLVSTAAIFLQPLDPAQLDLPTHREAEKQGQRRRRSIMTFWPSTYPSSRKPSRNERRMALRGSGPAMPAHRPARSSGNGGDPSFNHLIRPEQQRRRDREAEGL